MKKTITAITLLLFFLTTNCQTIKEKKNKEKYTPSVENPRKVLIGFNQNFSMMPNMNEAISEGTYTENIKGEQGANSSTEENLSIHIEGKPRVPLKEEAGQLLRKSSEKQKEADSKEKESSSFFIFKSCLVSQI